MTTAPILRSAMTGLVLAGGRGQRMGGRDKGLQRFAGRTLVEHVLERMRPQVATLLISANRHHDAYAAFGEPVVCDATPDFAGPLAGMLAGLRATRSDYLLTAPCDSPYLPEDLGERLAAALSAAGADAAAPPLAAYAVTPQGPHPVFALLHRTLADDLAATLAAGEHRVRAWLARHKAVQVHFGDERPFYNVNTLDDLQPDTSNRPDTSDTPRAP
ncbi:molybdenum cofactor guanylyltransferase MobA [Pandoraea sp. XJJ-1]|uniref:molybdenum cofactor guanylyltransferase MobA n=1 Tax=unclassified Pandoraea TaxID=2624094 RepID=UPI0006864B04|nr:MULTISPECIES: molybdenum cofactor guanylyltransferase MobA [unclassified Pandoraea]OJY18915.1 MAG: molybdenum cofactor guanylyltransferase [Pandoraea sp. 64-18]WAL82219.1 molybdenum cofactor guanylyltransferase MobA [Pandoraea sp. XJJ-1]